MSRKTKKDESCDEPRSFLQEIPEDKKALLELNFKVSLMSTYIEEEKFGTWSAFITDNKGKKTTLQGKLYNKLGLDLVASIEAIKYIYSKLKDDKSRNYVCVEIATSNVYVTNVLREWIFTWSKDDFKGRPNAEYLREILPYLLQYKEKH